MSSLRCMIVDDEPLAIKMLENYVNRTPFLELAASFSDPVLALSAIKEQKPELVFMDIQMPDLNGLELSKLIPSDTKVIFTTAFKQYAFESYEVSAIDFLLKPIRYQKFLAAADKARTWFDMKNAAEAAYGTAPAAPVPVAANDAPVAGQVPAKPDYIFIKVDGALRKVMLKDILYIEGLKDYVQFHVEGEDRPMLTHITMKGVEEMLPKDDFMRVHRSFIVALKRISAVEKDNDILIGRTLIHVSDAYKDAFLAYLKTNVLNG